MFEELFTRSFQELILQANDIEITQNLIRQLQERKFALTDVGVTSRVFNSWKEAGLIQLPNGMDSKWLKLNFVDYVWLCLIKDLRKIGMPINDILEIRKSIFKNFSVTDESIVTENALYEATLDYLIKQTGSRDQAENYLDKMKTESGFSRLTDMIKSSWAVSINNQLEYAIVAKNLFNRDSSLVVWMRSSSDSVVLPTFKEQDISKNILYSFIWSDIYSETNPKVDWDIILKSHIFQVRIPLSPFILDFIANKNNESNSSRMGWISAEEYELLEHIRGDSASEIKITLRDGKDSIIHVTKKIKPEIESNLLRRFGTNDYGEIRYVIDGGRLKYIESTKKFKLPLNKSTGDPRANQ